MLKPVRTVAPDSTKLLISLAEALAWLRVDDSDSNPLVTTLIATVTEKFDGYAGILGRALINQTWRVNFESWPSDNIRLPFSPVSAITTVKHYDASNVQQTVASANYSLLEDSLSPYVKFISTYSTPTLYDRDDSVEILFVAGYGADATYVPAPIRTAALLTLAHLYENREAVTIGEQPFEVPMSAASLLEPYRLRGV